MNLTELASKFSDLPTLSYMIGSLHALVKCLPSDKNAVIDEICSHLQSLKEQK